VSIWFFDALSSPCIQVRCGFCEINEIPQLNLNHFLFFSIGGIQSNSMLAIAKIVAQHRGSQFYYISRSVPQFLKDEPSGNYAEALSLGMKVITCLPMECKIYI
jgi:hypothetical protein